MIGQGARLAAVGLPVGTGPALWLGRSLSAVGPGIGPAGFRVAAAVAPFLLAVAVVACYLPARAAARLDPMETISAEKGRVVSDWRTTANSRRARYYRLTPTGRAELGPEQASWRRHVEGVALVLRAVRS